MEKMKPELYVYKLTLVTGYGGTQQAFCGGKLEYR